MGYDNWKVGIVLGIANIIVGIIFIIPFVLMGKIIGALLSVIFFGIGGLIFYFCLALKSTKQGD